jgi:hypothetical protein
MAAFRRSLHRPALLRDQPTESKEVSRHRAYLLQREKGEEVEQPADEIKASEEPVGEHVQRYRAAQPHSRYC